MRFRITTSGSFYSAKDAEKLKTLGFKFESTQEMLASANLPITMHHRPWHKLWEENDGVYRDFSTLEELMAFVHEWGECVIGGVENVATLEIYDDYRE